MLAPLQAYSQYPDYHISSPGDAVIQILINRPESYNTFTERMWKDLGSIFRQVSHDAEYRVIILSATGTRGFSAGVDLHEASNVDAFRGLTGEDPARRAAWIRRYITDFQAQLSEIERCEKPVICALFSTSYGIAVDIACCCDIRICSEDTVFAIKEIDIAIAADLGTLTRLPKLVGCSSWVKSVCLTGMPFTAAQALDQGFVSEAYPSKDECIKSAQALARVIASKSPVATTGVKAITNQARDQTVAQSLHYTAVWNASALQSEDVSKAISAFKTKSKPEFAKL
ncbi:MAG: putative secondary metabolism biosynthetic enzyme [Bathelium mastoideum]|nr:MAG: putative secondary metabolism biosynthetic enzyme [Bathelium mastoideum]